MQPAVLIFLIAIALTRGTAILPDKADSSASRETGFEEKIRTLEDERNHAILAGDVGALDRMTTDDYTFVTLRGEMRTKKDILEGFKSGSFKYQSRTISDVRVRRFADTAIVTGRSTQMGAENGQDYSGSYWFTRVYVRQNGRWLSAALQTTRIEKP